MVADQPPAGEIATPRDADGSPARFRVQVTVDCRRKVDHVISGTPAERAAEHAQRFIRAMRHQYPNGIITCEPEPASSEAVGTPARLSTSHRGSK